MSPPRSVADATRFTATGPHAFTRAPPSTGAETPQQRVARLRDAAKRARVEQISTFDRIVDRGRIWADRAHKVVALGLIGATVVCGGITIFAFTDMVMFARRKKRAYLEEQRRLRESTQESQVLAAVSTGADEATVRQALAVPERKTVTTRIKEWALSGLTPPEKEGEKEKEQGRVFVEKAEQRQDILSRPGADDLVKGGKAKGGSTGVLSSITGWWNGGL